MLQSIKFEQQNTSKGGIRVKATLSGESMTLQGRDSERDPKNPNVRVIR